MMKIYSLLVVLFITACASKELSDSRSALSSTGYESLKTQVVQNYAEMVYKKYSETLEQTQDLLRQVKAFTRNPSEASHQRAKDAWIKAREIYGKTEVFRYYGGPIDHEEMGVEPLMNAWPLDEAYIDYVEGNVNAGIINRPKDYPKMDKQLLAGLNEKDGEKNISTGFHAIEFLLWGQDQDLNGPGNRSYKDYVSGEVANADRRAAYLEAVTELLVDHLKTLKEAWKPSAANYRQDFVQSDPQVALANIMTGMGMLIADELAGERTGVAYETQAQEDEQSCFSDTTLQDLLWNIEGVENVYLGKFGSVRGPGISQLLAIRRPPLDIEIQERFDQLKNRVKRIDMPFDQAIIKPEGRKQLELVMAELDQLADSLTQAAKVLDVRMNLN